MSVVPSESLPVRRWAATRLVTVPGAGHLPCVERADLITDEMLHTFCLVTDQTSLAAELKKRYNGLADRLTLYIPFTHGERDDFWSALASEFTS